MQRRHLISGVLSAIAAFFATSIETKASPANPSDSGDQKEGNSLVSPFEVTNVDALRKLVPNNKRMIVLLLGYWQAGDGGGGLLQWMPSSTNDDDGVFVFRPIENSVRGRWERSAEIVDVKWAGAKSDGYSDDSSAIQNAASVAFRRGLPLYFPAGIYLLAKKGKTQVLLEDIENSLRVYGAGPATTLKLGGGVCSSDFVCMFSIRSRKGVTIEFSDLTIDMNEAENKLLGGPSSLEHCHAIQILPKSINGFDSVIIRNLFFSNLIADGVNIGGSTVECVNRISVDGLYGGERKRSRSDIAITCSYTKLNLINCITHNIEVEVNVDKGRVATPSFTTISNVSVSEADFITDARGEHWLTMSNVNVLVFFNMNGYLANISNSNFLVSSLIRISDYSHASSVFFVGCQFRTNNDYKDDYLFFFGKKENGPRVVSFVSCQFEISASLAKGIIVDRNSGTSSEDYLIIRNCNFSAKDVEVFINANGRNVIIVGNDFIGLPKNRNSIVISNENSNSAYESYIEIKENKFLSSGQVAISPCNSASSRVVYFLGRNYVRDPALVFYLKEEKFTNIDFHSPMEVFVDEVPTSGFTISGTRYLYKNPALPGKLGVVAGFTGDVSKKKKVFNEMPIAY